MPKLPVERVIFVEYWPTAHRLDPFEVVTEVHNPAEYGRAAWVGYHWYDCAVAKDRTLIIHMSGFGGLRDGLYVTRGPWWAERGVQVQHHGEPRIKRLPPRHREWPPDNSVEAPIVECAKCGWLADDVYDPEYDQICPHLKWDPAEEAWVEPIVANQ